MLSAAITPKRGVMRHLEDDTAKDFLQHPSTHAHTSNVCVHTHTRTHTFYPFIEKKQLGDKQSGRVRAGAREEERE